jgi:hypothetical protein
MTDQAITRDLMSPTRDRMAMAIQQFSLARNDYVTGVTRDLAAVGEARAIAIAAVGRYLLDLADLIETGQTDDATTMRAMAALLEKNTKITPWELASQGDLAERLARIA